MNQTKDDLFAVLERVKDAIEADRLVTYNEEIAYDPIYSKDGATIERFVPKHWSLDLSVQTKVAGRDRVMTMKIGMDL